MARRPSARAPSLTHLDARDRPTMVNVGAKPVTHRVAEAEARVIFPAFVAQALRKTGHRTKKGPVFDTAIVAGALAARRHDCGADDLRHVQGAVAQHSNRARPAAA